MAEITTKATLLANAATALLRTDFTDRLVASLPLAEAYLNRSLRLRLMESDEALVTVPGSDVVALPAGYLEPLDLLLTSATVARPINYVAAGFERSPTPCRPDYWTIDGAYIRFPNPADVAYPLTFRMLKRFALAGDGDTNALLTAWPDLYLMALLVSACGVYLTDDPRLAVWKGARDELMREVRRKEARSKALVTLQVDPALQSRPTFDIRKG